MQEKLYKAGIMREPGWLYYISNGTIMRTRMLKGGQSKKPGDKPEVVFRTDVRHENGWIYFLDKQGDVARSPASRGGAAKKLKKKFDVWGNLIKPRKRKKRVAQIIKDISTPAIEGGSITEKTTQSDSKSSTQEPIFLSGGSMEIVETKTRHGDYTSKIKGTHMFHNDNGPARIMYNGTHKEWRQFDMLHRADGPAVEDGETCEYYWHGLQHRLDGPAVYNKNETGKYAYKEYYILGESKTPAEFKKITSNPKIMAAIRKITGEVSEGKISSEKSEKSDGTMMPIFAVAAGLAGLGFAAGRIQRTKAISKIEEKPVQVEARI